MGEIIRFEDYDRGCKNCVHLFKIGKGRYMCNEVVYSDDTSVIPVEDGKRTDDWGACNGDSYVKKQVSKSKKKSG